MTAFTTDQIETLRNEYEAIEKIDPCQPSYAKLRKLLTDMTDDQLQQVRRANIKWLSRLATNHCVRRGIA